MLEKVLLFGKIIEQRKGKKHNRWEERSLNSESGLQKKREGRVVLDILRKEYQGQLEKRLDDETAMDAESLNLFYVVFSLSHLVIPFDQ